MKWSAELSDSRRFGPYINTDSVVKLLNHYSGFYGQSRNEVGVAVLAILFKKSLGALCVPDLGHVLWFLMRILIIKKCLGLSVVTEWSLSARKKYNNHSALARLFCTNNYPQESLLPMAIKERYSTVMRWSGTFSLVGTPVATSITVSV